MRDYRQLQVFELADQLAVETHRVTQQFPPEERYGLTSQMRRAAVSVPSNIVEGAGRDEHAQYVRFLDRASGSARELEYQASLAYRLGLIGEVNYHH